MNANARCSHCDQPLGSELATVHAADASYHFLCAMLKQRETEYLAARAAVPAA